jgi:hypothetical protein
LLGQRFDHRSVQRVQAVTKMMDRWSRTMF